MRQPSLNVIKYMDEFENCGFTHEQAKVQSSALSSIVEDHLVTKDDLRFSEMKTENNINNSETRLTKRIDEVDQKLTKRIDEVDQKLTKRIDHLEHRLDSRIDKVEYKLELLSRDLKLWSIGIIAFTMASSATVLYNIMHLVK